MEFSHQVISALAGQRRQMVEREFAEWFRVDSGSDLTFSDGWWRVESSEYRESAQRKEIAGNRQEETS